jgi:hypothetical protein
MSFDALTITGLFTAILCGGVLVALISRDDVHARRSARIMGSEEIEGVDPRS